MTFRDNVKEEWFSFKKKNESLLKEREIASFNYINFNESKSAKSILERKNRLEMIASEVQLAIFNCEEICNDFERLSSICGKDYIYDKEVEALNHKLITAEKNGITPDSQTKLRKLSRNKYKEGKNLKRNYYEISRRIESQYYEIKKNNAEKLVDIFWNNFSLAYQFIMFIIFFWRLFCQEGYKVRHLKSKGSHFFANTKIIKYKLVIWQNLLCSQIDQLRKECKQAKLRLKHKVEQADAELKSHREKEISWACKDQERLACYLEDNKALRASVIERFANKHPDEDISWLKNESKSSQGKVKKARYGRRRDNLNNKSFYQPCQSQKYLWHLTLCDDRGKNKILLPSLEDGSFTEKLKAALSSFGCQAEVTNVIRKLKEITSHSPESLRRRKRVSYAEPKDWKIFRCGKFRIIMDIIHSNGDLAIKAVFLVRKRDEAYGK